MVRPMPKSTELDTTGQLKKLSEEVRSLFFPKKEVATKTYAVISLNGGRKLIYWVPNLATLLAVLTFFWLIHQDLAELNREIGNIKGTLEGIEKNVDRLWDRVTSLEKESNP